ncbi:MAG: bifunctional proline dehydrogenase/L-glutamate gamma-semialdehyde dehydrogenase PutA [Pseudomonadota bacterium]
MPELSELRRLIADLPHRPEAEVLAELIAEHAPSEAQRAEANAEALSLVSRMRNAGKPGLMEVFLAEYGLSTDEGVALMCLAEALLRVPDAPTIDALIEDKIAPSDWGKHLGQSSSSLVNASTWALMLTGAVTSDAGPGVVGHLRRAIQRLGEPVIRLAVQRAMKELGHQFVLGQTIDEALERGRKQAARGYTYSYDMLGEAALTEADARTYFDAYANAIARLASEPKGTDLRDAPGISIKLSALYPRYEATQHKSVMEVLVPRAAQLCRQAADAGIGLNIDAEEADRLDLSLDVIEALLADPQLAGWDGFGVVVQAYGKRALRTIDWLHALASRLDRRIMVRLVKGAYWDTEIKLAQVGGHAGFPVFTRKSATDAAYICCANRLLKGMDRIYAQFATHNAHTVAAIRALGADPDSYEFQRLHGMGDTLYDMLIGAEVPRCRIYAPVGAHRDLLAYLVRRLLENGANSSFVHQILNSDVAEADIAADPFESAQLASGAVRAPDALFAPQRENSRGWNLMDPKDWQRLDRARSRFRTATWSAAPLLAFEAGATETRHVQNPADATDQVGTVQDIDPGAIPACMEAAQPWAASAQERAEILCKVAEIYEMQYAEVFALLAREAGKTANDAVSELREAVDFLRYYAHQARTGPDAPPLGRVVCISPWNFPLAIFTGQIAAALAAGNAVLAKPAESTCLIAARAVSWMHAAGVPRHVLQFLPGLGGTVGAALTAHPDVDGIWFTGSTGTAQHINRAMARNADPWAPLVAETGGINAMIIDSTALPEQAVRDVITSAFQSAGQRCSALRMLYVQSDILPAFQEMLFGAMDALNVMDPWVREADIGPVIDAVARDRINGYIASARSGGRLLKQLSVPSKGTFLGPAVISVPGIDAITEEVFGPVLHIAPYDAEDLGSVVDQINAQGYGLTFGMHSRIDDRVAQVTERIRSGNVYVNRNQIGAVVGSQPFGGEGLSGTGPKAGGPAYLPRFQANTRRRAPASTGQTVPVRNVQSMLDTMRPPHELVEVLDMPGPTGESNRLSRYPIGPVLCLGPGREAVLEQRAQVRAAGGEGLAIAPGLTAAEGLDGVLDPKALTELSGFAAVAFWGETPALKRIREYLASRSGPILPLLTAADLSPRLFHERHVSIDTTAAGGNAALLASVC